jgi:hypothetical protein
VALVLVVIIFLRSRARRTASAKGEYKQFEHDVMLAEEGSVNQV